MRVTVVTSEFFPISLAASVRITPLVDVLEERGHQVTVVTTSASKHAKTYNVRSTFFSGPSNKQNFIVRLFSEILFGLEISLRAFLTKTDVYFVTSPPFFMMLIMVFSASLKRRPYIIDVRDDYPRIYEEQGLIRSSHFFYKWVDKFVKKAYSNAFLVAGATQGLVRNIRMKTDKSDHVVLLRNGYISSPYPSSRSKREKFTAVFHGNLGKFQNIELLLEIAERLQESDVEFLVFGSGPKSHLLENCNLNNVNYVGHIPHESIMEEISRCHLGISFRIDGRVSEDAFPVKVYEYIGVGIPTIITPISEASTFIKDNEIGLEFSNNDKDSIVESILRLKDDRLIYDNLIDKVLSCKTGFERHEISRQFVKILEHKFCESN